MGSRVPIALLLLTLFSYVMGLSLTLAGLIGHSWWRNNKRHKLSNDLEEEGLWKRCIVTTENNFKCTARSNLFQFDKSENGLDLDIVICLLIVALSLIVVAIVMLLTLFLWKENLINWSRRVLTITFLGFFGMSFGITALAFSEVKFSKKWQLYDYGWTVTSTWVGVVCVLIGLVLTIMILCTPNHERSTQEENKRVVVGYANEIYELEGTPTNNENPYATTS